MFFLCKILIILFYFKRSHIGLWSHQKNSFGRPGVFQARSELSQQELLTHQACTTVELSRLSQPSEWNTLYCLSSDYIPQTFLFSSKHKGEISWIFVVPLSGKKKLLALGSHSVWDNTNTSKGSGMAGAQWSHSCFLKMSQAKPRKKGRKGQSQVT